MSFLFGLKNSKQAIALPGVLLLLLSIVGCNKEVEEEYTLTLSSISPTVGPEEGGTLLTIRGTGLLYVKTITIGGSACTSLNLAADTVITCRTPAKSEGVAEVVITNSIPKTVTSSFSYQVVPVVDSVLPIIGLPTGGTSITITGSGFAAGATVKVGSSTCDVTSEIPPTTIVCDTNSHPVGLVSITVTNTNGQAGIGYSLYSYRYPPTVTSVTPDGGVPGGGTSVTVRGTGFLSGASVTIDAFPCFPASVFSSTLLTCLTTAGAGSALDVTVTNLNGQTGTGIGLYTYRGPPTVTSIDVPSGPTAGGTTIIITGIGFVTTPTNPTVRVGTSSCLVSAATGVSITCTTTAASAGLVGVTVTNPDTQVGTLAGLYTYIAPPVISSIDIAFGPIGGGLGVEITGSNLDPTAVITFGAEVCPSTWISSTRIDCVVPAANPLVAGDVDITVTNGDGQTDVLINGFEYTVAPTVTGISPSGGPVAGGTLVTITGTGFRDDPDIYLGTTQCTSVVNVSDITVRCTTGNNTIAASETVTVTNDDGQAGSLVGGYDYMDAPDISSVNRFPGPEGAIGPPSGGTLIEIIGTGFELGATVNIGGVACVNVLVIDPLTIRCETPPSVGSAQGPVNVVVSNPDLQIGTEILGFTYRSIILDWDVTTYDFGQVDTDTDYVFTITNNGDTTSSTSIALDPLAGADPTAFSVIADLCSGVDLAPTAACTVQVRFLGSSLAEAAYAASLSISSPTTATTSVTLAGEKVTATLELTLVEAAPPTDPVDFGSSGGDVSFTFTYTNTGSGPTQAINAIAINLADEVYDPLGVNSTPGTTSWNIPFVSDLCSGQIIASGNTCTVIVTFEGATQSEGAGDYTAILEVSAPNTNTVSTDLLGTAL